jgi:hypothetical protein
MSDIALLHKTALAGNMRGERVGDFAAVSGGSAAATPVSEVPVTIR